MAKYVLQPNEAPILTATGVRGGDGLMSAFTDEIVLTNLHLIWLRKGMIGNVKNIEYFPLALLKVIDGRAQALLTKSRNGMDQLELFFQQDQKAFGFQTGGKREINEWMRAINRAVTGNELPPEATSSSGVLPGAKAAAESLMGAVRDRAQRAKRPTPGQVPTAPTAMACPGCSAPLSGLGGTVVRCGFCGTESTLR